MTYKIAVMLPSTTNNRNWNTVKETLLFKVFLKSFLTTYDKNYNYTIFLVVDDDDKVFSKKEEQTFLKRFIKIMKNVDLKIIYSTNIEKGCVTHMWNRAFKIAYDNGFDYFYQCGDDVEFLDSNWVSECINSLQKNNNVGLTGPLDFGRYLYEIHNDTKQKFLLTQTFVSRKHMEFFGFYFPEEIKNWFCDDWITHVYLKKNMVYLINKRILNKGGDPRYVPDGKGEDWKRMTELCESLVNKYCEKIIN